MAIELHTNGTADTYRAVEPRPLSAEDIRLIRKASDAVVEIKNGEGQIRIFIRNGDHQQTEATLSGFAMRVTDYQSEHSWGSSEQQRGYRASAYISTCDYNEAWRSLAFLVKTGDVLTISGIRGNDCENLRDAGFHADEMWVGIRRGKHRFSLLLKYSVGPNNSARMFQSSSDVWESRLLSSLGAK